MQLPPHRRESRPPQGRHCPGGQHLDTGPQTHRYNSTAVFDKRDSFTFNIVNFPHLSSNIPSKPAYGVYISQLVRIGRICSNFVQFKLRHYTLTQKLMKQGLCMAFRKFARSHVGIITKYGYSVRKHIEEGICLPATDAFLSRNICTCTR